MKSIAIAISPTLIEFITDPKRFVQCVTEIYFINPSINNALCSDRAKEKEQNANQ
jgi:hypothetical protein